MKWKKIIPCLRKGLPFILVGSMMLVASSVFAADETLGDMATNLYNSVKQFEAVLSTGSFLAGIGFAIGAIMKFKQHKDNPTNIPVGTPMALLFVAVALIFLPSLVETTGKTMFGSSPQTGGKTFFQSSGGGGGASGVSQ